MSALFHDVGGLPPDVREPVREAIVAYNRSVLTDDFHAVERTGEPSFQTNRRLSDLYQAVQTAEPEVGTSAFYSQAVSDLSDVTKARRNLALIVALERPFSGSIAVSDQPLRVGLLAPTGR
jgi:hypothetical protein